MMQIKAPLYDPLNENHLSMKPSVKIQVHATSVTPTDSLPDTPQGSSDNLPSNWII